MRNHWMKIAFLLVIVAAAQMRAQDGSHEHEWTYEGGKGPVHWGGLKAEYSTCNVGKEQSPIDIRNPQGAELPAIRFDYKDAPLKIVNNGHTIQVTYPPGSFIAVGDKRYELRQFHFHHPGEERIEGKSYDMVAHLVHADGEGKLAVVAVLFKQGTTNTAVEKIWARLPKTEGKEQEIRGVRVNATALLPNNTSYYTYRGSLTTPPCSEGVTWFVLKTPTDISPEQINTFAKIYPHNARPIQPIGEHRVKASQ